MKYFADRNRQPHPSYEVGGSVWLKREGLKSKRPCEKLTEKKIGPFIIKRQINPVSYELCLPDSLKIHPVFHVSLLEPYRESGKKVENVLAATYHARR